MSNYGPPFFPEYHSSRLLGSGLLGFSDYRTINILDFFPIWTIDLKNYLYPLDYRPKPLTTWYLHIHNKVATPKTAFLSTALFLLRIYSDLTKHASANLVHADMLLLENTDHSCDHDGKLQTTILRCTSAHN